MSYIVKIAENENAVLKIIQDDDSLNPRTEHDNFGTMVCWHGRYNLGDEHSYREPRDFLEDLAYLFYHENKTGEYIDIKVEEFFKDFSIGKDGDDWVILDASEEEYTLNYHSTEKEAEEELELIIEDFKNDWISEYASNSDLLNIISENAVILPLYLYDHSGITMNTTGFSCQWDSGQVGWIYATYDDVKEEYGKIDSEKAKKLLESEVETYDQYIKGEVYGYVLEKKIVCECCDNVEYEHIDSCWGFYGLEYLEEELKSSIKSEYEELVDNLDWAV